MAMAGPWTVTTADFTEESGDLASLTAQAVELRREPQPQQWPWRDVVSLEQRGVRTVVDRAALVLQTADGQRICGKPVTIADDNLVWSSNAIGEVRLPLQAVRGFARQGQEPPAAAGEDVVVLANRDELRGVVDRGEGGIVVQQGERKTEVKWENIAAISLAQVKGATSEAPRMSLRLTDGSVLAADQVQLEETEVKIQRGKEQMRLPLAQVAGIANLGGRVTYLAQLKPQVVQYTPQSPLTADPSGGFRVMETARIGERVYSRVIALRPRCTVRYVAPLDGQLHLAFASADSGPLTDMDILVQVNGSTVAETKGFHAAQPTPSQSWPVSKGQTVEIRADFGKNLDVQDTLLLLDAAFVSRP
jgi:hypothetical protein